MNNNDFSSILELVESKFGRGSSKNWKNRDFEDLNFEISKKTKTNISAHTLKRVFGKIKTDEYYLPQKATIQALKQYVNFEKNEIKKNEIQSPIVKEDVDLNQKEKKRKSKTSILVLIISILVISSTVFYLYLSQNSGQLIPGEIKLISTEGRIPASAQFEYSTPNNKDSFRICYDGNFEPIPVPNGKNLKSNYYYQYPGLFRVRMWKNKQIVSPNTLVYVQSKGWEIFGRYPKQKQMERFYPINMEKCMQSGLFYPTKSVISSVGMDTTRLTEITLNNYHPTGIMGDNFKLETTLKNADEWPGSSCNSVYLYIVGLKESIELHFANPGCSYWIHCRISEKKLDRHNENLKNFSFDLTQWQNIRIENTNKNIRVFVNNIARFSTSYSESIGEIMGVTVKFQGNGYLKNYSLTDLNNKEIFNF